jgi:hypothetical protein
MLFYRGENFSARSTRIPVDYGFFMGKHTINIYIPEGYT